MTIDGWTKVRLQTAGSGLAAVWASDDGADVVLGGAFVLLRGDGVRPWEIVPLRGSVQLHAAAGAGALRVAVGYPHAILVSGDGGVKWQSRAAAKRPIEHVVCTAAGLIVTAGEDGAHRSDDGGKTFTPCGTRRVVALDGARLLGVEPHWKESALSVWDDESRWWRPIGPMPPYVKGLARAGDALIAIAIPGAFRSVDGGVTWQPAFELPAKTYLGAVAGNAAGVAAVVGYDGFVAVSRDAGATWTTGLVGDRNLDDVCVTAAGVIWAVGADGVVMRSGIGPLADVAVAQAAPAKAARASKPARGASASASASPSSAGDLLRAASPAPALAPPEPFGAAVHDDPVTAVVFVDEDRVVSGDAGGRLALHTRGDDGRWTAAAIARGDQPPAIHGLAAVGGTRLVVADDDAIEVIDLASGRALGRADFVAARLIGRGARVAAAGADAVAIFDVGDDGALTRRARIVGAAVDLDLSTDGAQVAIVGADGRVAIHDASTGAARSEFRRAGARVRFAPDPDELYLVCGDYHVRRVGAAKGGRRADRSAHGRQRAIVTSPAARHVASLSIQDELDVAVTAGDRAMLGWDADTDVTLGGAPRVIPDEQIRKRVFSRHRFVRLEHAAVTALAISDGGRVAAGDLGGEVALFDAVTLALERAAAPRSTRVQPALDRPLIEQTIAAAGRSDDGRALLLGVDHRVYVVDPDTGEVQAGPRLELPEPAGLRAIGDVVIAVSAGGWSGHDRATGARLWAASFPVRSAVRWRGAFYGFEGRSSYAVGERTGHALYRLDPITGAVAELALPPPPGADDARGYGWILTPTARGLLAAFTDADRRTRGVLIDPEAGVVGDAPYEADAEISSRILHAPGVADPSGRYAMWSDAGGGVIRDGDDPALAVVARPRIRGYAGGEVALLVEAGRVVALDNGRRQLIVFDLAGERIATLRGLVGGESLIAGRRGQAVVTWSSFGGVVRRWPLR